MIAYNMGGATGYSRGSNEPPDFKYIYIIYILYTKYFFQFNTLIYSLKKKIHTLT